VDKVKKIIEEKRINMIKMQEAVANSPKESLLAKKFSFILANQVDKRVNDMLPDD